MSLSKDPAGHLSEPATPQHTEPAAPAGDAAEADVVASSDALGSVVEHSRASDSPATAQQPGGTRSAAGIKNTASGFAQKLRTQLPKMMSAVRERRSARRR